MGFKGTPQGNATLLVDPRKNQTQPYGSESDDSSLVGSQGKGGKKRCLGVDLPNHRPAHVGVFQSNK